MPYTFILVKNSLDFPEVAGLVITSFRIQNEKKL